MKKIYDVAIVGGGVSGAALLYVLSRYTNIKNILLIEKHDGVAQVNSKSNNNSQTLHFGDIETNYTFEKAKSVKRAAEMVKNYILKNDKKKETYQKGHKMALAVGDSEVEELEKRYSSFKKLFPKIKKIGRNEIAKIEPNVVFSRDPSEKILALYNHEGYTMNFGKLSESFVRESKRNNKNSEIVLGKFVESINKKNSSYEIVTGNDSIEARVVIVTAGAHSLLFAKSLGYGKELSLLMVAGNFYLAPKKLNGKVYTMQNPKLPFAAVHGDPEVHNPSITRFGPTAKTLLMLERGDYSSVYEYFKSAQINFRALQSFFKILFDRTVFPYIFRNNVLYEIPFVGKRLFLKEARKVVPSLSARELTKALGYGGVRPQIVNTKTKSLQLGEAKIIGENIIFNMTPSPGASTCLRNAEEDVKKIINFLGNGAVFNEKKFLSELLPSENI